MRIETWPANPSKLSEGYQNDRGDNRSFSGTNGPGPDPDLYLPLIAGVSSILQQTAPVKGSDIANEVVNPLLIEIGFAIVVFVIATVVK